MSKKKLRIIIKYFLLLLGLSFQFHSNGQILDMRLDTCTIEIFISGKKGGFGKPKAHFVIDKNHFYYLRKGVLFAHENQNLGNEIFKFVDEQKLSESLDLSDTNCKKEVRYMILINHMHKNGYSTGFCVSKSYFISNGCDNANPYIIELIEYINKSKR